MLKKSQLLLLLWKTLQLRKPSLFPRASLRWTKIFSYIVSARASARATEVSKRLKNTWWVSFLSSKIQAGAREERAPKRYCECHSLTHSLNHQPTHLPTHYLTYWLTHLWFIWYLVLYSFLFKDMLFFRDLGIMRVLYLMESDVEYLQSCTLNNTMLNKLLWI